MYVYAVDGGRPISFRGRREVSAFVLNILYRSFVPEGGISKHSKLKSREVLYIYICMYAIVE
jgi:hypothetical protein